MPKDARSSKQGKRRRRRRGPSMAKQADPHALYEASVQAPEQEVAFLVETFRALRGRAPRLFREDFCGTANTACRWVEADRNHRAIAVDIDPEVLEWGRRHHLHSLSRGARKRVELRCEDVRHVSSDPVDVVGAFNFSYWCFRTRPEMLGYFRAVRAALADDGLFFLDIYGGAEAYVETREKTRNDGFTYVWEQASYEPLSGEYICHIHFRFPDGSKIERAFSYHWRLWGLPEIRELLADAGFARTRVYWQGTDDEGEASGEFDEVARGDNDPAWIAYVVAEA